MDVKWNLLALAASVSLLHLKCKKEAKSEYTLGKLSEINVQGKSIGSWQPSPQQGARANSKGETSIRIKPSPKPTTKAEIVIRRLEIRRQLKDIEGKTAAAGTRLLGIGKRLPEIQKEISEILLVSFNYAKQDLRLDYAIKLLQQQDDQSAKSESSINTIEKERARIVAGSKEVAKQLIALESEKQILLLEQTDLNNLSVNQVTLQSEDADLEVAELFVQ